LGATREILEDLDDIVAKPGEGAANGAALPRVRLLGLPARGEADELALEMLRRLLPPSSWDVEGAPPDLLSAEQVELTAEQAPALICVASLRPGGLARSRYLCKRLRARFPDARIVVGRWGTQGDMEKERAELRGAGADAAEATLQDTVRQLTAWLPVL